MEYRYSNDDPVKEVLDGCLSAVIAVLILVGIIILCSILFSCSTPKETSYIEHHKVERMMDRMDSVINSRFVIQQDSTWRETILKQFQSIREKSDTSHTVVVDSAGKVIKERIVINNIRETTNESERKEREGMIHRMEVMDSTMNIMRHQLSTTDSLLRSKEETEIKEVEKPLSWWQNMRLWLGNIVLIALAVAAIVWIVKKRTWWLTLIRKVI